MAHRRPRGPHGYVRSDNGIGYDSGGWPQADLRSRFLAFVTEDCPDVQAELRQAEVPHGLEWPYTNPRILPAGPVAEVIALRDHLRTWATAFYLDAPWILDSAATALLRRDAFDEPVLLRYVWFSHTPALVAERFVFDFRGFEGAEAPSLFRQAATAAFEAALNHHVDGTIDQLESDPEVERVDFMDRRSVVNLCRAAQWQTRGGTDGGDSRGILAALKRIGLQPRPGLAPQSEDD